MEGNVRVQDRTNSVRRRRFLLRQCPHCGGDVRLVRDIYGSYRQCMQCSREVQPDALQMPVTHPLVAPLHAGEGELLAA